MFDRRKAEVAWFERLSYTLARKKRDQSANRRGGGCVLVNVMDRGARPLGVRSPRGPTLSAVLLLLFARGKESPPEGPAVKSPACRVHALLRAERAAKRQPPFRFCIARWKARGKKATAPVRSAATSGAAGSLRGRHARRNRRRQGKPVQEVPIASHLIDRPRRADDGSAVSASAGKLPAFHGRSPDMDRGARARCVK